MKKVLVIIKREYLTRVRTKAFVIGTIITPLLMLALVTLPAFFATRGGGERNITVFDQSGDGSLFETIKETGGLRLLPVGTKVRVLLIAERPCARYGHVETTDAAGKVSGGWIREADAAKLRRL